MEGILTRGGANVTLASGVDTGRAQSGTGVGGTGSRLCLPELSELAFPLSEEAGVNCSRSLLYENGFKCSRKL